MGWRGIALYGLYHDDGTNVKKQPMELLTFAQHFLGEQSFSRPRTGVARLQKLFTPAAGRCFSADALFLQPGGALYGDRWISGSAPMLFGSLTVLLGDGLSGQPIGGLDGESGPSPLSL